MRPANGAARILAIVFEPWQPSNEKMFMKYQNKHINQLKSYFPPREFGKRASVNGRTWFKRFKWLHYNAGQDAAYCFVCCKAVKEGKIEFHPTQIFW